MASVHVNTELSLLQIDNLRWTTSLSLGPVDLGFVLTIEYRAVILLFLYKNISYNDISINKTLVIVKVIKF